MVPNPNQMHNPLEDPLRDSAIHFGVFLQLNGQLNGGDDSYGNIEVEQLLDQFTNHYQPRYRSYLVVPELLSTLRRFRVILRIRRQGDQRNGVVRVVKHPYPAQVKGPKSVPRQRLYVDQNQALREPFVRTNVVNEGDCRLCGIRFFNEQIKSEHINSDEHKFRLQYREKRSSFKPAVGGASIVLADVDNDSDLILRTGERRDVKVQVTLNKAYSDADIIAIFDVTGVTADKTKFSNDEPIEVNISAMFSEPGAYIYPLVAKIMPARLCLLKDLIFRVESELMDQLAPVSPYIHRQDVVREMEGSILPGEMLPRPEFNLQIKVKLGDHKVPQVYNKLMLHKLESFENMSEYDESVLTKIKRLLCGQLSYKDALSHVSKNKAPFILPLDKNNYSSRFEMLVDLEELQQQRQIKNYDRSNERLEQCSTKFLLRVPDLSEGRPSVRKGDKVHVRLQDNDKITYEGVIHEIREQGLLLGFHREFNREYARLVNLKETPKVDVRFTVNRFSFLNMHRALSLISKHKAHSVVFPERRGTYFPPTAEPTLQPWVNPLIGSNPQQQAAVRKILSKSSGNAPYLVFGPPGTGKTVTLVETIAQVWLAKQTLIAAAKQLVCAPSNAACDNIAERLLNSLPPTAKILRLYSLTTEVLKVPEKLLPHCNYDKKSKNIFMPTIAEIMAHHIIVVTIVSSGRLVTGGAGGQFHYVYIDECGQASEPEALIAIAGLLTTRECPNVGQLVLAGDPQQLGPILCSQPAKDFGLGMSFLERLMKHNNLYKRAEGSGYDSSFLTKLVQNFRSHPNILHIPNQLFYDNELEVKGDPDIINKALRWTELPNPDFPIIFHGVQGLDERESNSPSYFNRSEIEIVITYMNKLIHGPGLPNNYRVKEEDIGVITPYRKQVQKFRKAFELLNWKIKVGSVEEFQGSERMIIFISTVRSNITLVEEDYRFSLGFLKNPKRFNVSVTRAKALLIVVGNPNILRHDKQWYQLLKYCRDNRATVGMPFPDDDPPEHQPDHIAS